MPELTNTEKLDAILMFCAAEELPALLERAQIIFKTRSAQPSKRPYVRKTQEPPLIAAAREAES